MGVEVKVKSEWFMGKCSDEDCSSAGDITSVRFSETRDNFLCWRCDSDAAYRSISPFVNLNKSSERL